MSPRKMKSVDAVVVGSGVAGSIICMELANAGLDVLCLERGRMVDPQKDFATPHVYDELHYERHSDIFQNLSRETLTFRNSVGERALPMREMGGFKLGEVVGGAGVHWGGNARRFFPEDFELRTRVEQQYGKALFPEDCTAQDWGVQWDEIEPYYDMFEQIYGVGGKAGNIEGQIQAGGSPHEGPRSREYPNPPTKRTPQGQIFADACLKLGYTPYQGATAAMTQDYRNLYRNMLSECQMGGFCSSYVCAHGAKATPLSAVMPALYKKNNFELRSQCNVIKVTTDSTGKQATGVIYIDPRGQEIYQPASIVVLAAYCFNNVRLLLLSGIGEPYDPNTGRGVVGRNYAYQSIGRVDLFFDDREFNPFIGGGNINTSIDDLDGHVNDRAQLGFVGGVCASVANRGATPLIGKPVPPGTPRWGPAWKKAVAHNYLRTFSIVASGSCMSYRQNYLDLDPAYKDAYGLPLLRMTFDWHDNERKLLQWSNERCMEIARACNPASYHARPVPGKYSVVPYGGTHNVGGAVMGLDPKTSVVNKYLQSWDVPNLFVVGGSAFPQNASNGPTETIGMLACWTADAIKESYLGRPGPLM
ncbi:MAG: GMC family oxidoreductase [Burkholderiales bacterium]|nr:GMC family oxidoreductase [Burkholderiales bacterium]